MNACYCYVMEFRHEFSADATIREIFSYIDINRTDDGQPYVLEMLYPHRIIGPENFMQLLKELDLVPRSTLYLKVKLIYIKISINDD